MRQIINRIEIGREMRPVSFCLVGDPFTLATAGASFLGSMMSADSSAGQARATIEAQKLANEANLEMNRRTNENNYNIAKEANDLNYRMFDESNKYNTEMWNKTNEYNDPTNVVARLKKAGLNPLSAFGSDYSAQDVSSASAAPAATAQMQAGHVEPESAPYNDYMQQAVNGAFNGVKAVAEARMASAAAGKSEIDQKNAYLDYLLNVNSYEYKLTEIQNKAKVGTYEWQRAKEDLEFFRASREDMLRQITGQADATERNVSLLEEKIATQQMTNENMQIVNQYLPKLKDQELRNLRQEFNVMNSQIMLNGAASAEHEAAAAFKRAEEKGVRLDNSIKKQAERSIVNMYRSNSRYLSAAADEQQFWRKKLQSQTSMEAARTILSPLGAVGLVYGLRGPR